MPASSYTQATHLPVRSPSLEVVLSLNETIFAPNSFCTRGAEGMACLTQTGLSRMSSQLLITPFLAIREGPDAQYDGRMESAFFLCWSESYSPAMTTSMRFCLRNCVRLVE